MLNIGPLGMTRNANYAPVLKTKISGLNVSIATDLLKTGHCQLLSEVSEKSLEADALTRRFR